MAQPLTIRQKKLKKELDQIFELLDMNYQDIITYDAVGRIAKLGVIKSQIVRSTVIMDYTLIDELLSSAICHYFFGRKKSFPYLRKTKKFQNFNYHILENLYLLQKFELMKNVWKVKNKNTISRISDIIPRVNSLRNGLAHSFFPENRKHNKPEYRGKDIFTIEGLKLFLEDIEFVHSFLLEML